MSLAAGIPIGFGAGFATGIAAGTASGEKKAREEVEGKILQYASSHKISIEDANGAAVSIDSFIREVIKKEQAEKPNINQRNLGIAGIILGCLMLAALVIFFFL